MSRGLRNNNPGNIRHDNSKWQGEVIPSKDKAFKQFTTIAYGYRAMIKLLQNYKKLHGCNTIRKMINRYAPPIENHTENYIDAVSRWSGIDPDTDINVYDRDTMISLVSAMSRMENGVPANVNDVQSGWDFLQKTR